MAQGSMLYVYIVLIYVVAVNELVSGQVTGSVVCPCIDPVATGKVQLEGDYLVRYHSDGTTANYNPQYG